MLENFCIGEVDDDVGEHRLFVVKAVLFANIEGKCSHFDDEVQYFIY